MKESKRDTDAVFFGWLVPITNNSDHDGKDIIIRISFRDKDDLELDSFLCTHISVPIGQTVNATSSTDIDLPLWNRTDHYVVNFEFSP